MWELFLLKLEDIWKDCQFVEKNVEYNIEIFWWVFFIFLVRNLSDGSWECKIIMHDVKCMYSYMSSCVRLTITKGLKSEKFVASDNLVLSAFLIINGNLQHILVSWYFLFCLFIYMSQKIARNDAFMYSINCTVIFWWA